MLFLFLAVLVTSYVPKEKVWIYFTDKGYDTEEEMDAALQETKSSLSERVIKRRLMVKSPQNVVDYNDLPVCERYIEEIEKNGGRVCEISRWLNAATFVLPGQKYGDIIELPFVEKIRPVARFRNQIPEKPKGIDYGESGTQIRLLELDRIHEKGYIGDGILIGILDTGYKKDLHSALKDINIVAEYDFISRDSLARYDQNDTIDLWNSEQIVHGSHMLSLLGARATGQLVGGAFGADFAVARTELLYRSPGDRTDIISEEGWWIEGVEYLEFDVGADIISSSLGYRSWGDSTNYRYQDMDGSTTPLSIVASMCIKNNVLLVTAMGNVTNSTRPDTCIKAPADADSIIACGGVDEDGDWYWQGSSGSSIGPPYDQIGLQERTRWKPDVCGPWVCYAANPWWSPGDDTQSPYVTTGGTSCATAMVAGAATSILSGHRVDGEGWDVGKLREAILTTATLSDSPTDTLGYGILDAYDALYYEPPSVTPPPFDEDMILFTSPNPFTPGTGSSMQLHYRLVNNSPIMSVYIFTLSGRLVQEFKKGEVSMGKGYIEWNGRDTDGNIVSSGVYICLLETSSGNSVGKFAVIR